jgi:hypothetical protein
VLHGEGHGRGEEPGSAALKNLPAYGAWNVEKVAAGTGRPSPARRGCGAIVGATRPITGEFREVGVGPGGRGRRP